MLQATGGKGVDHVVEIGGVDTIPKSVEAVAQNGTITIVGGLSGFNGGIPSVEVIKKTPLIRGVLLGMLVYTFECADYSFVGSRDMYERLHDAIALHNVHPVIDKIFKFEELQDGLKYLKQGSHFGKIVLKVEN